MGERLVIKVHRGQENIASLYYHWGAYSSTAVKLIETLCECALRLHKVRSGGARRAKKSYDRGSKKCDYE